MESKTRYIGKMADSFVMGMWDKRFTGLIQALSVHKSALFFMAEALPIPPYTVPSLSVQPSSYPRKTGPDDISSLVDSNCGNTRCRREEEKRMRQEFIATGSISSPHSDRRSTAPSLPSSRNFSQRNNASAARLYPSIAAEGQEGERAEMLERGKKEEKGAEIGLQWAELSDRGLISLGLLAVLLGNDETLRNVQGEELICTLEGVLKATMKRDADQERQKRRDANSDWMPSRNKRITKPEVLKMSGASGRPNDSGDAWAASHELTPSFSRTRSAGGNAAWFLESSVSGSFKMCDVSAQPYSKTHSLLQSVGGSFFHENSPTPSQSADNLLSFSNQVSTLEVNFMIVYIRIFSILSLLVRKKTLVPLVRVCGFVEIALLLLQRPAITWGLIEELVSFLLWMTRHDGKNLLGNNHSHQQLEEVCGNKLESELLVLDVEESASNRSQEAVPIIIKVMHTEGLDASSSATSGKHLDRNHSGNGHAGFEGKTASLRVTVQGMQLLMMLSTDNAPLVVAHRGLNIAIAAMKRYKHVARLQLVGGALCRILMAERPERFDAAHLGYHEHLLENLTRHAENAGIAEVSLSGLKRLTFQSPDMQEKIAAMKPFTCISEALNSFRENKDVIAVGLALLCNLARSAACSAALIESGLVALAASSIFRFQENADVAKYGAWMVCNVLSHKKVPRQAVEQVVGNARNICARVAWAWQGLD